MWSIVWMVTHSVCVTAKFTKDACLTLFFASLGSASLRLTLLANFSCPPDPLWSPFPPPWLLPRRGYSISLQLTSALNSARSQVWHFSEISGSHAGRPKLLAENSWWRASEVKTSLNVFNQARVLMTWISDQTLQKPHFFPLRISAILGLCAAFRSVSLAVSRVFSC